MASGHSLFTVFCNLSSKMIGESATRKGERAKKVPKYMQYDDADYAAFPPPKTADQKERPNTQAESYQIAKLLQKFLLAINQKFREYQPPHIPRPTMKSNGLFTPPADSSPPKPTGTAQGTAKRPREGVDAKTGKGDGRKPAVGGGGKTTVSSSLQLDQDYHGMLSDHIRSAYPNITHLTPEMLRSLEVPKQLLQQNGKSKGKDGGRSKDGKEVKGVKKGEELKPFKRQSYHVAIAYHIHLKRIRSTNPNAADIDPTYPARKMRESQRPPPF